MVITNYRLPQIERPTKEILDDDDNQFLAALKIILNGFKKAQKRTRAITKAYNELESITLNILKEYNEGREKSPKNEPDKPLEDKNNLKVKSSTPRAQDCQRKKTDGDKGEDGIEMIDLTSIFDTDQTQQLVESTSNDGSSVFRERRKRSSQKRISSQNESPKDDSRSKFETEIDPTTARATKVTSKQGNIVENQGNEENRPPFWENSPNKNDSFSRPSESRSSAKIGFAKSIYNVEISKTPNRKSTKQSTLVFQPIPAKTDITVSEKPTANRSDGSRYWGNLFDEDYRAKRRNTDSTRDQSTKTPSKSPSTSAIEKPEVAPPLRNNEEEEREEKSARKIDTSLVIPTASQIDETARSLFDDEDHDDFQVSPDILNTCVESHVFDVHPQPVVAEDPAKTEKILDPAATSPSHASQFPHSMDSIDETFFAPAEKINLKTDVKENIPLAGCSKIFKAKDSPRNSRSLKRKSVDDGKELEDLALQDINWDADFSNENWASSKRPLNNSFDLPPEKTKKIPEYANQGKVERNKAKRSKLRGWDCRECEEYYGKMDLPEEELKKRMDACSRHRSKFNPRYYTPKGFWDPEFPEGTDSSDCSESYPLHNRD